MRLLVSSRVVEVSGRLGPACIACGNTRSFWIQTEDREELREISSLPDRDARITSCGRCRSRNSIVVTHVD
jgi:hypothetical protein